MPKTKCLDCQNYLHYIESVGPAMDSPPPVLEITLGFIISLQLFDMAVSNTQLYKNLKKK